MALFPQVQRNEARLLSRFHFFLLLQRPESESIRASLRLLASSATRLLEECKAVPSAGGGGGAAGASGGEEADNVACLTQQVIQSAYDIAKAAKQLVTHVGEL